LVGARQKADRLTQPKVQLQAFLLQQLKYTLLELELPHLLAPDLPSNGSSLRDLDCTYSNYQTQTHLVLLFIVTASPCQDWVICVPAAFHGCGSYLSGSLSRIEP
jgi:hypothetical protein